MIALLQRVSEARVVVDGRVVGAIAAGLLVLVCAEREDDETRADALLAKLLGFRVFAEDPAVDPRGRMNRSLLDVGGGLLLVPQFTLAADTRGGTRPGFSTAAPPEQARALFEQLVAAARERHPEVASGRFGANMRVALVNEGPVTFWLES